MGLTASCLSNMPITHTQHHPSLLYSRWGQTSSPTHIIPTHITTPVISQTNSNLPTPPLSTSTKATLIPKAAWVTIRPSPFFWLLLCFGSGAYMLTDYLHGLITCKGNKSPGLERKEDTHCFSLQWSPLYNTQQIHVRLTKVHVGLEFRSLKSYHVQQSHITVTSHDFYLWFMAHKRNNVKALWWIGLKIFLDLYHKNFSKNTQNSL